MKSFLFPAVDIKAGKAVRLVQGDPNRSKTYYENPVEAAGHWASFGFEHLHVVDLDGAFSGEGTNRHLLPDIVNKTGKKIQVGGGIRSVQSAARCLEAGAWRIVVGTLAIEQPIILKELIKEFGEKIAVGVDTKDGKVATRGWVDVSAKLDSEFIQELAQIGVATVIYTDISRDGMLTEPNFDRLKALAELDALDLIASGGVANLDQLKTLRSLGHRIVGAIAGMALYENKIDPLEAAEC